MARRHRRMARLNRARAGTISRSRVSLPVDHFGAGREWRASASRRRALIGMPLFIESVRLGVSWCAGSRFSGTARRVRLTRRAAEPGREARGAAPLRGRKAAGPSLDVCDLDGLARERPRRCSSPSTFRRDARPVPSSATSRPVVCPYIPLEGTYEQYLEGCGGGRTCAGARSESSAAGAGGHLHARARRGAGRRSG